LRRSVDETARRNAARHVAQRLGRLRGLPQKMGQILGMSMDAGTNSTESVNEPLMGGAEPVGLQQLLPVLQQQWGRDPYQVCRTIEPRGLAASLGQVHRAVLRDGRVVAVKIQYPGIRSAVAADLDLLAWVSKPLGGLHRGFDLQAYREALRQSLDEELDYRVEARHQGAYAAASRGLGVIVPEVVAELSTELVLTTIWEDGDSLECARAWEPAQRACLARTLTRHFLVMLFEQGWLHADPHAGNYRFRNTAAGPEIVLYDYGCVRKLPDRERLALMRLIHETHHEPDCDPFELFVTMGFDADALAPLRHKLPALCRVLFAPFSSPLKFDLDGWDRGARVGDILGDDRWNFRISGPAGLVFLMRAFHGLTYYLSALGESVSWAQLFEPLVQVQTGPMAALELAARTGPRSCFSALASKLCIRITDGGVVQAKVTLPVAAVDRLGELVDDDVRRRIEARGISLSALQKQVRAGQYAPQELFRLEDKARVFEVWLD